MGGAHYPIDQGSQVVTVNFFAPHAFSVASRTHSPKQPTFRQPFRRTLDTEISR